MENQTPTPDSPLPADEELSSTPMPSFDAVPLRQRADGWTPEIQHRFIEYIADTGSVRDACLMVGMSRQSAYALRRHPDGAALAAMRCRALTSAMPLALTKAFGGIVSGTDARVERSRLVRQGENKRLGVTLM